MEPILNNFEVKGLNKSFNGQPIFQELQFVLHPGERLGIIGDNGAGKTTLLNILSGLLPADKRKAGDTSFDNYLQRSYISSGMTGRAFQVSKNISELNGKQNLLLTGRDSWRNRFFSSFFQRRRVTTAEQKILKEAREMLAAFGLNKDDVARLTYGDLPARNMSFGEQRIIELVRLFLTPRPVYLLDEPTTHLSVRTSNMLADHIKLLTNKGFAFIIVSHDERFLKNNTDRLLRLTAGRSAELISTPNYFADKGSSIHLNRTSMVGNPNNSVVLEIAGLEIGYQNKPILHAVDLQLCRGEVIVVIGQNGAGKSTLLKSIIGLHPLINGRLKYKGKDLMSLSTDQRVKEGIAYVFQEKKIFFRLTTEENLIVACTGRRSEQKNRLEKLYARLPTLEALRNVHGGMLSGGQQQMLAIGRALIQEPGLILFDEPFAGLSPEMVSSVSELIRSLAATGIAFLIIEHDLELVNKIADRVLILKDEILVTGHEYR